MKKKVAFGIIAIMFFSHGCFLGNIISESEPNTGDIKPPQRDMDSSFSESHYGTNNEEDGNPSGFSCEVDKWIIHPFIALVEPIPGKPGWNRLHVALYEENQMNSWGNFEARGFSVSTEDGFTYPQDSDWATTGSTSDPLLPPKFNSIVPVYLNNNSQTAITFKVAETQNDFTLHIDESTVYCLSEDSLHSDSLPSTSYRLTTQIPNLQWPTSLEESEFSYLDNSLIDIPGTGTISIQDVIIEPQEITIKSQFTNANQGFNYSGILNIYAIGNDGRYYLKRLGTNPSFTAGPAQTINLPDITIEIPLNLSNIKIVFADTLHSYTKTWGDPTKKPDLGALAVFNLRLE